MRVLIDTSVWVDHFKRANAMLTTLLLKDGGCCHPLVLGELACGTPPAPRRRTLDDLGLLQSVNHASMSEVFELIEDEQLYGLGCGWVDLSLLASVLITPDAQLWTHDKRLSGLAQRFGVRFEERRFLRR